MCMEAVLSEFEKLLDLYPTSGIEYGKGDDL